VSVVVTVALGGLGSTWSRRHPASRLLLGRIHSYSVQADPRDYAQALIPGDDFEPAMHALRRAGLAANGRSTPTPPDAPLLNLRLYVFRPVPCVRPDQERVSEATRRVLGRAGIDGRVDGLLMNGQPIPIFAPVGAADG
jgi:hypothetical protein